ncbi:MAG TPA: hypothetical protein VMW62_02280, partial [Chloroflexota bacterium]|nr:hypothetical protein [Chloroflexota bacterium]
MLTPFKLVLGLAGLFAVAVVGHLTAATAEAATTYTWTGSSSANWSVGANWSPASPPTNGDILIFPAGPTNILTTNDISSLTVSTITFNTGAPAYHIGGNPLTISVSLTVISGAAPIQIDAPLSGAGSIVMNGSLLTLTASNGGLTGNVSLNTGGSISAASGALGSGTLTLAGGNLQGNGASATLSNPISVTAPSTIGGSVPLTLTGAVSGSTSLTQNDSITLTLSATNFTFTGDFTNSSGSGTTVVSTTAALGTGPAIFGPGTTLQGNGSPLSLSNSSFTFNGNPTISGSSDITLSNAVTAPAGLTMS